MVVERGCAESVQLGRVSEPHMKDPRKRRIVLDQEYSEENMI
jgi:hypothetical protein